MNSIETETGSEYKEWTDVIDSVREELNNNFRKIKPDVKLSTVKFGDVKTDAKFKVGDRVYYRSDVPLTALGHKQPTQLFRAGDYHFNVYDAREIKKILYYPNNVRYLLDGKRNVSYAESELKIADNPKYVVKSLIDKKILYSKVYYLVWWKYYDRKLATWEPRSSLVSNGLIKLIQDFDNQSKKQKK